MIAENGPENADRPSVETPVTTKTELKLKIIEKLSERVMAMGYPLATSDKVLVDPVYRVLAASMLKTAATKEFNRTLVDDIARSLFNRIQSTPARLTSSQKKRMSRVIGRQS